MQTYEQIAAEVGCTADQVREIAEHSARYDEEQVMATFEATEAQHIGNPSAAESHWRRANLLWGTFGAREDAATRAHDYAGSRHWGQLRSRAYEQIIFWYDQLEAERNTPRRAVLVDSYEAYEARMVTPAEFEQLNEEAEIHGGGEFSWIYSDGPLGEYFCPAIVSKYATADTEDDYPF